MADTTLSKAQPAAYTPRTDLDAAIASQPDEAWVAAAGPREHGFLIKIDDEYEFISHHGDQFARPWQVERGALGSTKAAHSNGATVSVEPSIGGSISATGGQGGSVANVTEIQTPGTVKQVSAGIASVGGSVVVDAADPGAIGPNNLWLQVVFGDPSGDGGYGRLWVRNSDDTGWNSGAPMAFGDATTTFLASPNDVAEMKLADAGGSYIADANGVQITAGAKALTVTAAGISVGAVGAPRILSGSDNPPNVDAPAGSLYLTTDGAVYIHTNTPGAANWAALAIAP